MKKSNLFQFSIIFTVILGVFFSGCNLFNKTQINVSQTLNSSNNMQSHSSVKSNNIIKRKKSLQPPSLPDSSFKDKTTEQQNIKPPSLPNS